MGTCDQVRIISPVSAHGTDIQPTKRNDGNQQLEHTALHYVATWHAVHNREDSKVGNSEARPPIGGRPVTREEIVEASPKSAKAKGDAKIL